LEYYYPPLMLPGWLVHLFMFAKYHYIINIFVDWFNFGFTYTK